MTALSKRTERLVACLFAPEVREGVRHRLERECGAEALGIADASAEGLERIRFAVLRVSSERPRGLEGAFALARIDWRDLLMEADFGHDLRAHDAWCRSVLGDAGH